MSDVDVHNSLLSDYEEPVSGAQCKSVIQHNSRSLRFYESMSLFLRTELYDNSDANPYAELPKLQWNNSYCNNEDDINALNELTNKKFIIFKVTPMYNFSYLNTDLRKYSAIIKKMFEKNSASCEKSRNNIEVTFHVIEKFSSSQLDEPGVQIHIKDDKQVLYEGYLISWKNTKIPNNSYIVNLPVLLCHCRNKTDAQIVHSTIKRLFDISIIPVVFPQDDFICFSTLIMGYLEDENSKVVFTYHAPDRPKYERLKFKVALTKLTDLWNSVIDVEKNIVPAKNLLTYQLSLENYVENVYKMYLEHAWYNSMLVPNQVDLSVNGRIKIKSRKF